MSASAFERYTDEAHRGVVDAWPELGPAIVRPTYAEAERAAHDAIIEELRRQHVPTALITFVHHPHREGSDDPMDAVGSWGWKLPGEK